MFRGRRSFRRGGFRKPLGQLNWVTQFTGAPIVVAASTIVYVPLSLQVESEQASDQIVQRVRGQLFASGASALAWGQLTLAMAVEDAKDLTLGNVAALPNPRGASLEEIEQEKYLYLGMVGATTLADSQGGTRAGYTSIDVKARRKIDVSSQQLVFIIANATGGAITISTYFRTLFREKV